jgi:hypothetical protein
MQETVSPHLSWRLLGPGSADCYLDLGGEDIKLHTTYVGDALRSLMRAAMDLKIGSSATLAYFFGEPGGYRMVFSGARQGEVYMQVILFPDLGSRGREWLDGHVVWAGLISIDGFVLAVQRMSEKVLEDYGEEEYLRIWGLPFPSDMIRLLKG